MQRLVPLLASLHIACAGSNAAVPRTGAADPARSQVYVVGTLYRRHELVKVYDLAELRRIIEAIDPDVLVLDVTPRELDERKVFPGKIEYPGAVFPFLRPDRHRVYPGEPPEPIFTEIVSAGGEARRAFAVEKPAAAAALEQLSKSIDAALLEHWRSAAEVNDTVTEDILAGKHALEGSLIGPVAADGWKRWNEHAAGVVRRAVADNPGKRVLVLVGVDNRYMINARLRGLADIELVDMASWLRGRAAQSAAPEPAATGADTRSREKSSASSDSLAAASL